MSYCARCLDDFRYDDTGGYNPPARCQEHCRNCCEGDCMDEPIHLDDGEEGDTRSGRADAVTNGEKN